MKDRKEKIPGEKLVVWGQRGAPLLPESLRALWAAEALPAWVQKEARLPPGSQLGKFDRAVWQRMNRATTRLRNYLVSLVNSRRNEIENVVVVNRVWPLSLRPEDVPWQQRTRNRLLQSGILRETAALPRLTYGQLFAIHAMGTVSILDFACTLEATLDEDTAISESGGNATEAEDTLLGAINDAWADQVSERDPRFAGYLPPGQGTVLDRIDALTSAAEAHFSRVMEIQLAEAVRHIREQIRKLESAPLETALRDYVQTVTGYSDRRLEALLARFGWSGKAPCTLEEAGSLAGVTRERIRQLQERFRDRLPPHPVVMPALDRALAAVRDHAPLDTETASALLAEQGITSSRFHPSGVVEAARICGRTPTFRVERIRGHERVGTTQLQGIADSIIGIASRQAHASGAANVPEVVSEATARHIQVTEDQVREVLHRFSDIEFLLEDWFWDPAGKAPRNRLRNVTRKMLSVASPIDLATLRDGLRRAYRQRELSGYARSLIVPPLSVLDAFYRAHPEFVVDDEKRVRPVGPLDYRNELGHTEQTFVVVLRSTPTCVLDRTGFARACIERGVNDHTFSQYTTYSPVLEHLGTDIWTLRGVQVAPAAVEALRFFNAARPRERRVVDHGWTASGAIWVAIRLPNFRGGSFVLSIPAAIRRYVADREFAARSESGSPAGTIRVGSEGLSTGVAPFLVRNGADQGDILVVEFDLVGETATLRLGGEEQLDELAPE